MKPVNAEFVVFEAIALVGHVGINRGFQFQLHPVQVGNASGCEFHLLHQHVGVQRGPVCGKIASQGHVKTIGTERHSTLLVRIHHFQAIHLEAFQLDGEGPFFGRGFCLLCLFRFGNDVVVGGAILQYQHIGQSVLQQNLVHNRLAPESAHHIHIQHEGFEVDQRAAFEFVLSGDGEFFNAHIQVGERTDERDAHILEVDGGIEVLVGLFLYGFGNGLFEHNGNDDDGSHQQNKYDSEGYQ